MIRQIPTEEIATIADDWLKDAEVARSRAHAPKGGLKVGISPARPLSPCCLEWRVAVIPNSSGIAWTISAVNQDL